MRWVLGGALAFAAVVFACGDVYNGNVASTAGDAGDAAASPADEAGPATPDSGVVPGPILDDAYTAGTRLQPNFLTVGTTRMFVDWWDTQLHAHCEFKPSAANEYRCVPKAVPAVISDFYWSNAGCTAKVLIVTSDAACLVAPRYVDVGDACNPHIVTVGAPAGLYYKSSGTCSMNATSTNAFAVGADIAPTSMVRGTIADGPEDLGGQLKAQYVTADDGAHGFHRLVPKPYPLTGCAFRPGITDPTLRCYPTMTAPIDINHAYGDAACARPLFSQTTCAGDAIPAVGLLSADSDRCNPGATGDYFALGPAFSGQAYRPNPTVCQPFTNYTARSSAGKIDLPLFGAADRQEVALDGGLRVVYALMPSGHRTKVGWSDPAHGGDCTFAPGSDGMLHCLPSTAGVVFATFSDQGCAKPIDTVYSASAGLTTCRTVPSDPKNPRPGNACPDACTLPLKPAFGLSLSGSAGCSLVPATRRLFRTGDLVSVYAEVTDATRATTCTALTRTDEATYTAIEVPAATLASGTLSYP